MQVEPKLRKLIEASCHQLLHMLVTYRCLLCCMQVKPELRKLIEAMPLNEGRTNNMTGDFNVGALLPEERSYFTYEGSLTTPPCT
jgi:carbonic anhydrase